MNSEFKNVHNWFLSNKLALNTKKTHFMIFGTNANSVVKIKINDNEIQRVKSIKFLGVTIDEDLKWKNHVNNILCIISRNIGIMNRMKDFLPEHVLILLYNSLILPYLNYCNINWGSCNKYLLDRIYKLQKRAIRILTQSSFLAHTRPLFLKCKILPIFELYKYN